MSELLTAVEKAMRDSAVHPHPIPDMTDPRGEHWRQPSKHAITVDDESALMTGETFEQLPHYSYTIPTGGYQGKMWKRYRGGEWTLVWFGPHPDLDTLSINYRKILIA